MMKLYGYSDSARQSESPVPEALAEVNLVATPAELRALAEFLTGCAAEMETMGNAFDHVHLGDRVKAFNGSPHFVVARDPLA